MSSTTDLQGTASGQASVAATDFRSYPTPFPLVDMILASVGKDPVMLGATGYADEVFTVRLVGDSE